MSEYTVLISTAANKNDAKEIAKELLGQELIACAQVFKIDSLYTWKGEMAEEEEFLILLKTKKSHYEAIEETIKKVHKYETPELIELDITSGLPAYLAWMDEVTR